MTTSTRRSTYDPPPASGPDGSGGRGGGAVATMLGILALIAAVAALALVLLDDDSAGPERGVSLNELVDDTQAYVGDQVTVSARVDSTVGPGFVLGGDIGETVLVAPSLNRQALPPIAAEDVVQVTGTVREFGATDFESLYGVGFDDAVFDDYAELPVIVATGIDPTVPDGEGE